MSCLTIGLPIYVYEMYIILTLNLCLQKVKRSLVFHTNSTLLVFNTNSTLVYRLS